MLQRHDDVSEIVCYVEELVVIPEESQTRSCLLYYLYGAEIKLMIRL